MLRCRRYAKAIRQAKANLADVRKRGEEALGDWQELARELFTPEERSEAKAEAIRMFEQAEAREEHRKTGRRKRRIA